LGQIACGSLELNPCPDLKLTENDIT